MPGLPLSEFWHGSKSTFSWDLAQACCAFTEVSLGQLNGRNRDQEWSCFFRKVFQTDLFSSYCKMETFGCRAWFRDQRDRIVLHLLNCAASWAIWHGREQGYCEGFSPGIQLSFCDFTGAITILLCRHAQMLYLEVPYSNWNWTEFIALFYMTTNSLATLRGWPPHLFLIVLL